MDTRKMKHLLLMGIVAAASAGAIATVHAHPPAHGMQEHASAQPGSDTWITTKVKADLLATENVSGLDIKVETVDGVVTLSGAVASKTQKDKAIAVAKQIKGVKSVEASGLTLASR